MFVFALKINAQLPTVSGVRFGMSYEECKAILDKKYNNGNDSYQLTPNSLTYYKVTFGGHYFRYIEFTFQKSNKSYLSRINAYYDVDFGEQKDLQEYQLRILEEYKQKYTYRWETTNDDGFKNYVLGENPFNKKDGFISISIYEAKNNDGEKRLWLNIDYGPVNFINPNDEI
jgi:hypothetical protein